MIGSNLGPLRDGLVLYLLGLLDHLPYAPPHGMYWTLYTPLMFETLVCALRSFQEVWQDEAW
jgi:hypothetical protein